MHVWLTRAHLSTYLHKSHIFYPWKQKKDDSILQFCIEDVSMDVNGVYGEIITWYGYINTLRLRQNGQQIPDNIFKCLFLN